MLYRRTAVLFIFLATAWTCTTSPKYVACSDDASCQAADPRFAYCMQKRCVECVTNSGCGMDGRCMEGICEQRCRSQADCKDGRSCSGGFCAQ